MERELTHLSLFSGIGGLDLAAEWAGFRTVGQCEWADYPRAILEKHWPGLPRWKDIRDLTGADFHEKTGIEHPTVVSGGFPCQPHSLAGKRLASDDERDLWDELFRVYNDDGISTGLDRLKCYGNAVVPQQFYPVFEAIARIERMASE